MKKEMNDRLQKKINLQKQTEHYLKNSKTIDKEVKSKPFRQKAENLLFNDLLDEAEKYEQLYQFHNSIIQNIHSGMITIDEIGDITFANKASVKLTQYSMAELTEMNISNLLTSKHVLDQIKTIEHGQLESECITKNKNTISLKLTIDRYSDRGNNHDGYILMLKDHHEEKLILGQKQEREKTETIAEISAGIAHELRNPLAGIKSIAQVIESQEKNSVIEDCIKRIVNEVNRANDLLMQFFKYAKPSEPIKQFESIDYAIERVIKHFDDDIKKKNLSISLELSETTPQVYTDISQIEFAMKEVFKNAIDASNENAEIIIEKKLIDKANIQNDRIVENEFVMISIIDQGLGIDKETIDKIFNPFFTTYHYKKGLGLPISKRFIEKNGGIIEYDGSKNNFTRFNLLIPIH